MTAHQDIVHKRPHEHWPKRGLCDFRRWQRHCEVSGKGEEEEVWNRIPVIYRVRFFDTGSLNSVQRWGKIAFWSVYHARTAVARNFGTAKSTLCGRIGMSCGQLVKRGSWLHLNAAGRIYVDSVNINDKMPQISRLLVAI